MKIAVILGSTREVRRGGRVGKWIMPTLENMQGAEFELLDLQDYPMPFYEEDTSPDSLESGYKSASANKWRKKIGEADGFIIITPEYNHAPPAVLKNALDYVYSQWNNKPVAFVSYAPGAAGGIRAVEQLRTIAIELQMAPISIALHIDHILDSIDEDGNELQGNLSKRLEKLVDQLLWWATALKAARDQK